MPIITGTPAASETGRTLSKEEIARYSRHLIMPEVGMDGQKKLKAEDEKSCAYLLVQEGPRHVQVTDLSHLMRATGSPHGDARVVRQNRIHRRLSKSPPRHESLRRHLQSSEASDRA